MQRRRAAIAIGLAMLALPGLACTNDVERHVPAGSSIGREVTISPPAECQADWQMSLNFRILAAIDAPAAWAGDSAAQRRGTITAVEGSVVTYVDADDGTVVHFTVLTSLGPPCS